MQKKYIDTVKSDLPVSGVAFIGKKACSKMPKAHPDNYESQKKYLLLTIGFDNSFERNSKNNDIKVISITIWKNSKPNMFSKENEVDSLLKIDKKI